MTRYITEKSSTGPSEPCIGCAMASTCAQQQMACAAFYRYVNTGNRVSPTPPSRRYYQLVFATDEGCEA